MANLKYKNANGEWKSLNSVRGPKGEIGPQGPKGDVANITINGENKKEVSFYAPINSGNENEVLISKGDNLAPEWQSIPKTTTIDNLEEKDYIEGNALSAHQGYILNENKVEKSTTIAGLSLQNNILLSELANVGLVTNEKISTGLKLIAKGSYTVEHSFSASTFSGIDFDSITIYDNASASNYNNKIRITNAGNYIIIFYARWKDTTTVASVNTGISINNELIDKTETSVWSHHQNRLTSIGFKFLNLSANTTINGMFWGDNCTTIRTGDYLVFKIGL